ncbi:MAG: hypothetical protein ACOY93_21715 [Bacillota bacterium]
MLAVLGWGLLWTLIGLVGLLLLLLALLLFLPLAIEARIDSDRAAADWEADWTGTARWRIRIRWGWVVMTGLWAGENLALTQSELRFFGLRTGGRRAERKRERQPKKKMRKRWPDLELLRACLEEFLRFANRVVRDLGFRFAGELTYGFPDPSVTGWCEAVRWGAGVPVPIRLTPEFQHPCLTGWAEVQGRTYGYRVALAALRALRNPIIRRRLAERIRFRPVRYLLVRGG